MKCEKCGTNVVITSRYQSGRFCSPKCSHSRMWSDGHKHYLSDKMRGYRFGNALLKPKLELYCKLCGIKFETYPCYTNRQFCSRACSQIGKSKVNTGGVRLGSGRAKTGYYKGIYCGSTYELAWVIYNIDHSIKFERNLEGFPYIYEGMTHKYYPDFKLNDAYVEIKGRMQEQDVEKWKQFPHKLAIINKRDIKPFVEYIKKTYGVYELKYLYEGNPHDEKPEACLVCGEKCKKVYCSRKCAGIGVSRLALDKQKQVVENTMLT